MQLEERVEYDYEWDDLVEEFETMCKHILKGSLKKWEDREEEFLTCQLPEPVDLGIGVDVGWTRGVGNWIGISTEEGATIFGKYVSKDDELLIDVQTGSKHSEVNVNPLGVTGKAEYGTLATNVRNITLSRLKHRRKVKLIFR